LFRDPGELRLSRDDLIEWLQIVVEPKHMSHIANDLFCGAFIDLTRDENFQRAFAGRDLHRDRLPAIEIKHAPQFPILAIKFEG
jgi:hypothetical protein